MRARQWSVVVAGAVALVACTGSPSNRAARPGSSSASGAPSSTTTTVPARPSEGCGKPPPVAATSEPIGDVSLEFVSGGQTRTYRFGVPPDYDPARPTPLILNLHGSGSNADEQSLYSQLPAKGTRHGDLVVTPNANNANWELPGQGADDDFLMGLVDHVAADYCVDLNRVDAAGISLGSWKATITACTHPDRIAALVLVAEDVLPKGCAKPVVAFHGTADPVVPYGPGGDTTVVVTGPNARLPGAEANMQGWATQAGCSTDKDIARLEPDVEHWTFRNCPPGREVEFYRIEGGGHTWPGTPIAVDRLGKTTHTIDATDIALAWFDAHPLRP